MARKLFKKNKTEEKNQTQEVVKDTQAIDEIMNRVATEKQTIATQSLLNLKGNDTIDTIKNNEPKETRINGYYGALGTAINDVRYTKSLYVELIGEDTEFGIIGDMLLGHKFGTSDIDNALHIEPMESAKIRQSVKNKIALLEDDYENEKSSVESRHIREQLGFLHNFEERLSKNIENPFKLSHQVLVSNSDYASLKRSTGLMINTMKNKGVFLRSNDAQQAEGIMSITPLDNNKREFSHTYKPMESTCLADYFPFGLGSVSHRGGTIIGENSVGNIINYDNRDPSLVNYNRVTLGQSGSGKSYANKILSSDFSRRPSLQTIIDYEHENQEWIETLGMPYVYLDEHCEETLNVFVVPTVKKNKRGRFLDIADAANTALTSIFRILNFVVPGGMPPKDWLRFRRAVLDLYETKGFQMDNPASLYDEYSFDGKIFIPSGKGLRKPPRLLELYELISSEHGVSKYGLKAYAEELRLFTQANNDKTITLFDNYSTVDFKKDRIIGISLEPLDKELMRPIALTVVTTNVWDAYEKAPKEIPKEISVDEAQHIFATEEGAQWYESKNRIARRRNIGFNTITQGLEVFTRNEYALSVLKLSNTKLIFRQEPQDIEAIKGKFHVPAGIANECTKYRQGDCAMIVDTQIEKVKFQATPSQDKLFNTDPNNKKGA